MSKEELMQLKNAELKAMCRERNLPVYKGKTALKKAELVESLYVYESARQAAQEKKQEARQERKPYKAPINPVIAPELKKEIEDTINNSNGMPWVMKDRDEVINGTDPGTLIAFLDKKGKPRTAKLVHRSASRRIAEVVTEFDWTFMVPYDKVLWVRRGTRWPKAVYNMLKGYKYGGTVSVTYEKQDQ